MIPRRTLYIGVYLVALLIPVSLAVSGALYARPAAAQGRLTATPKPPRTTPSPTPIVTSTPAPTATPTPGDPGEPGAWVLVDSPNVAGRNNRFNGLAVVSADDVWAVGEHYNANASNLQTLAMRWDGSDWDIVSSPNPDTGRNRLLGVAAVSPDDVWAVGVAGGTAGPDWYSLVLHWNGSAWSNVPAPQVGPPGTSELHGVAALAADDVWAVGAYSTPDTGWWDQPLVLHWDGSEWINIPAPAFGSTSKLNAVVAVAPDDVWAVGTALENNWKTLVLHWDGEAWTRVTSPNLGIAGNTLLGLAAVSATDVWAVGTANNGNSTLTLHWNGSEWSLVPSPNGTARPGINRNVLQAVTAIAADDVWAVGVQAYSTVGGAGQPIYFGFALIEHWDGAAWTEVAVPPLPGTGEDGALAGVDAAASGDVWAAGSYYEPDFDTQTYRTLIERYMLP